MTPYKLPADHNLQSIELSPFGSFMNFSNFGLMKQYISYMQPGYKNAMQ